jgi:hypothetical protein
MKAGVTWCIRNLVSPKSSDRFKAILFNERGTMRRGCFPVSLDQGKAGSVAGGIASAKAPPATARPAAWDKKTRLVGTTGKFVGSVLSTLSAWIIGFDSVVVRVRAGVEVRTFPSACNYGRPKLWPSQ